MANNNLIAIVFLLISAPLSATPLIATQYSDFNHYVLALSWQAGFCHSMNHQAMIQPPAECRSPGQLSHTTDLLSVHGLWPDLPESVAAYGVDQRRWRRFGCAARPVPDMPEVRSRDKCQAADTGVSAEIMRQLSKVMPGAGAGSCLERYEYAKHGVCFGFDPDAYFATMIRFDDEIKHSPLGTLLTHYYGQYIDRETFDVTVAGVYGEHSVNAFKLICHGYPAHLTGIQVFIKATAINAPLTDHSFQPQFDRGNCGERFMVDPADR